MSVWIFINMHMHTHIRTAFDKLLSNENLSVQRIVVYVPNVCTLLIAHCTQIVRVNFMTCSQYSQLRLQSIRLLIFQMSNSMLIFHMKTCMTNKSINWTQIHQAIERNDYSECTLNLQCTWERAQNFLICRLSLLLLLPPMPSSSSTSLGKSHVYRTHDDT